MRWVVLSLMMFVSPIWAQSGPISFNDQGKVLSGVFTEGGAPVALLLSPAAGALAVELQHFGVSSVLPLTDRQKVALWATLIEADRAVPCIWLIGAGLALDAIRKRPSAYCGVVVTDGLVADGGAIPIEPLEGEDAYAKAAAIAGFIAVTRW